MERILYFDYCAVLILFLLLITTIIRGMNHGRAHKLFISLVLVSLISALADIAAVLMDQYAGSWTTAKHVAHCLYLIFHNAATPIYMMYLIVLSDTEHKMGKIRRILFVLPVAIVVLITLTNPLHNKLFYFDSDDAYTRGPIFWSLYVSVVFYVAFGIYHLLRYKSTYERASMIALSSVFVLTFGAMMVQLFFPALLLEMLANALGLLMISTVLQRPEEYIDTDSGIGKESAYAQKIGRVIKNEKPCKLILIDIRNFGSLHRMLGYKRAVELLKAVADKLEEIKINGKYQLENYYIGAGRFRMLFEPVSSSYAKEVAEEVNGILAEGIQLDAMNVQILPVVCSVDLLKDIKDMESLMVFGGEFDKAKYTGKVMAADEVFGKKNYDIIRDIDEIIERALQNNSFEVYYQPIYNVKKDCFNSAEALLRLKDEHYGFISPETIITAAENSGSIHRIGAYVLDTVCSFIASDEYKAMGLEYIEVNLSVTQCMRTELADEVVTILGKHHVRPEQLNLEITETAASFSQKALSENIQKLTNLGISMSLDDYGTGYSNIRRIASMPFDIIKLDKSFASSEMNPKLRIVIENTIRMIKDMDLKIVIEGIETADSASVFAELGCDYIQGYYYSKPVPKSQFVEFIQGYKN